MLVKKHQFAIKQKGNPQPLVKKQYSKTAWWGKVENLENSLLTAGAFVFQNMPQELFIRECSFINIIPRRWALLHHNDTGVPLSLSRKSPQCNSSLGEGRAEERGGYSAGVGASCRGRGQTKGRPITRGHGSSASQHREIHHLQDQTVACAQGRAQWKQQPPMLALSFLSPLFTSHPHLSDSHQRQRVSFSHTLWNPTQVRTLAGPDDPQALSSVMARWWYIPVFISLCEPVYTSPPTPSSLWLKVLPEICYWPCLVRFSGHLQKKDILLFALCW